MADIIPQSRLFRNFFHSQNRYPRQLETPANFYENKDLILQDATRKRIVAVGIPDEVDDGVNEMEVDAGTKFRLTIFSDMALSESELNTIDSFFTKSTDLYRLDAPPINYFPIFYFGEPNAILSSRPVTNYTTTTSPDPSSISKYVEFRHLDQRDLMSNILWRENDGFVWRFILPVKALIVLIMPDNFVSTGLKTGYFTLDYNIIVRVFSKCILTYSKYNEIDNLEVTSYSSKNKVLTQLVKQFYAKLGVHAITVNDDSIVGQDTYFTCIVGDLSNRIWH